MLKEKTEIYVTLLYPRKFGKTIFRKSCSIRKDRTLNSIKLSSETY